MKVLNLFGLIAAIFSLLSLADQQFFISDLFTNFKQQYYYYLFSVGLINLFLKKIKIGVSFLVISIINLYFVIPTYYSTLDHNQKLLNVYYANVWYKNSTPKELIHSINNLNPDFIGLLEITEEWGQHLEVLKETYPYYKIIPKPGNFGIAIFSKFKFQKIDIITHQMGIESLYTQLKVEGEKISIFLTHPFPPLSEDDWTIRNNHINEVAKFLEQKKVDRLFLMGDFNSAAWSPAMLKLKSKLNLKLAASLMDTWPTYYPPFFRISIDHAFVSANLSVEKEVLSSMGSDHFPISYQIYY